MTHRRKDLNADAIDALALFVEAHPGMTTSALARAHPAWAYRTVHIWLNKLRVRGRVKGRRELVGHRNQDRWYVGEVTHEAAAEQEDAPDPILTEHRTLAGTRWVLDHPVGVRSVFDLASCTAL